MFDAPIVIAESDIQFIDFPVLFILTGLRLLKSRLTFQRLIKTLVIKQKVIIIQY